MRLVGVPTSEVGYTAAMHRREDHEVYKDMWWHWTQKEITFVHLFEHHNGNKFFVLGTRYCKEMALDGAGFTQKWGGDRHT